MTTPVSFEIAKLLKEKRFRQKECPSYLLVDFSQTNTFKTNPENIGIGDLIGYYVPNKTVNAPTIAEVVMWLYEKHDVYIHMSPHGDEEELLKECKWWFSIYQNTIYNLRAGCKVTPGLNEYSSLPEAYEAAIEYCLNKLI